MRSSLLLAALTLGTATPSTAQDADAVLVRRWQAHYEAVERELLASAPAGLSAEARAARAERLAALRAYRERGLFTRKEELGLEPRFVDAEGRRCAVAELLHASGQDALVERIARSANRAWVVELGDDPELARWLAESGLTLAEAVRIQTPAGCSNCDTVPPSLPKEPPNGDPGRPRGRAGPPAGEPSAPTSGGAPVLGSSFSELPAEEAWWVWWEYNKLAYLGLRGLERRLVDSGHGTRQEVARLTDPLRRVRAPLLAPFLADPDALVRAAAALAFGRVARGEEVLALIPLFEDPSRRVRESALLGLGASGTSEGAQVLLAVLENGGAARAGLEPVTPQALPLAILALAKGRRAGMDAGVAGAVARMAPRAPEIVRERALWAVCAFQRLAPDPALEAVVRSVLEDRAGSRWLRAAAIEALGDSPDPVVLARLQDQLNGRDLELRRSAALALARSPQALATEALLTAWELEAEPLTRGFLLLAIGERGGARARGLLLQALERGPLAVEPWAALGLGLLERGAAVPDPSVTQALLAQARRARREGSRPAFGLALGLARAAEAGPLARAALTGSASPRERAYAATALALLGGSESRELLRAQLGREPSDFVRANLAQALSALGGAQDADSLGQALSDLGDPILQGVTAASLGQLGEAAALAPLEAILREPRGSALVRATALDGLGLLLEHGDPLALPEITRASNYTLYENWELELFLRAL